MGQCRTRHQPVVRNMNFQNNNPTNEGGMGLNLGMVCLKIDVSKILKCNCMTNDELLYFYPLTH